MAKDKLIDYLAQAGFKDNALKTAWAIAKRESGGRPDAFNPDRSTGDLSYGLFQINMLGKMGEARRRQFGLNKNEDLFNPALNAKVAYQMSKGGTDFGPWGIGPNAYRKMPALNFDGFPGAGAAAPSGGGVPAAPAASPMQQPTNNGMQRTMAIINHFRQQREGNQQGVMPLIGQLMQLSQQRQPSMPQVSLPGITAPPAAPSGGGSFPEGTVDPALISLAKQYGLQVTSGYRSPEKQAQLYANRSGPGSVGKPGRSNHNFGRAIDVAVDDNMKKFLAYAFANPSLFREVFYDPYGKSIKNGKIVNYTIGGHSDHAHIAR